MMTPTNDFDSYQIAAMSTMFYPEEYRILFLTLGLAGEVGEVANQVKKVYRDDKGILSEERREKIIRELGDSLWYMAALCVNLDITMGEVASRNIEMLASRKKRGTLGGDGDDR